MGLGLWKPLNVSWGLGSGGYYPKNHDRNSITSFCPVKFHSSHKDPSVSAFFPAPSSFPPVLREWVKSIILRVLERLRFLLNTKQLYQVAHCSTVSQVLMDGGKERRHVTGQVYRLHLKTNYMRFGVLIFRIYCNKIPSLLDTTERGFMHVWHFMDSMFDINPLINNENWPLPSHVNRRFKYLFSYELVIWFVLQHISYQQKRREDPLTRLE